MKYNRIMPGAKSMHLEECLKGNFIGVDFGINKSIETLDLELEKIEGYGQKIDISSLDFKKIEDEFLKVKENQNVAVQSLKDKVAK
jgi:hypothetical protein